MTVWIDTPAWPHRGQLFAHMVSDTELEELHDVAERAGVHPRAFDRDHYDVPERLLAACIDAGATQAPTRRLVQALRESGLRLTKAAAKADREARRARLLERWPLSTARSAGSRASTPPTGSALAEDLLDRWSERHRRYHDPRHLEHCLDSLATLGGAEQVVELAAWFHDAVYEGRAGEDEEASAQLAEHALEGLLPRSHIGEVARLVRLTAGHRPQDTDDNGTRLCDADLAILGAEPARYARYTRDVRVEYAEVPLVEFRHGRRRVLAHLLGLDPLYRTPAGAGLWSAPARTNLTVEAARLDDLIGA
ncbi:DUF4031 domain-containing protein [Granulicoccus sp. GXG6511]|uniref:DUF4031 domain-containing protein n=1 Tax=Granulicoccus sp. GXG6511 TaxID=3381351 RepID=UPI003D7F0A11